MTKPSPSLEDQIITLQKHFAGIVVTVKALKSSVDSLESKIEDKQNKEINDIMEVQKRVDDSITANANAIKALDKELQEEKKIQKEKSEKGKLKHKKDEAIDSIKEEQYKERICRYYNRGHCKYKGKCRYFHHHEICKVHIENENCQSKDCQERHPKRCKWSESTQGCKREQCSYMHVTLASGEDRNAYKCISCNNIWEDRTCVVRHLIKNTEVYFCLNCDDWVQQKDSVLELGWSLLDTNGCLRRDV